MTAPRDAPTLLFEFEQVVDRAPVAAPEPESTWTPPSSAPIIDSMPVPLPAAPTTAGSSSILDVVTEGPTSLGALFAEAFAVEPALPDEAVVLERTAALQVVAGPEEQEPEAPEPEAPDLPLPGWARALGVFDLETTGIDTATARIVTAHVGLIDETGAIVERKDWIVDPGVPIPEGASAVHGITDERAHRFGRRPGEVVAEILAAIRSVFDRGFPLVVYNAPYDLTLLAAEADRHRLWPLETTAPIIDPFVLDKQVDRFRKGKRTLTRAAEVYGVPLTDAHDAGADAIAAGRVAQAMARRHAGELGLTAQELHDAQVAWCLEQAERFQAHMREQKDPGFTASGAWPHRS